MPMRPDFQIVFARLRGLLRRHAGTLTVTSDTPGCYCLEAPTGPAAVKAWGGKMKRPAIPVAWVRVGKAYVSYHLMGVYGNPALLDGMSPELRARMQGKTCFNFTTVDEALFAELDPLTGRAITGMKEAGFVAG